MAIVIYRDLDGSAPRISNRGVTFIDGVPVEVSDQELIAMARRNRFFEVEGEDAEDESDTIATDGSPIEESPKRKGGWPKGKPRKPQIERGDDVPQNT